MPKHTAYVSALSPEYVLLGFLGQGPAHGYELHRRLRLELSQVWHITESQIYNILKRLQAQGDIVGVSQAQPGLPDRRIFHLTPQGQARFEAWMAKPTGCSVRAIRVEFVTRLYFAHRRSPNQTAGLVQAQIAVVQQGLVALTQELHALQAAGAQPAAPQTFNLLGLEFRIQQLGAALVWLQGCAGTLEQGQRHD